MSPGAWESCPKFRNPAMWKPQRQKNIIDSWSRSQQQEHSRRDPKDKSAMAASDFMLERVTNPLDENLLTALSDKATGDTTSHNIDYRNAIGRRINMPGCCAILWNRPCDDKGTLTVVWLCNFVLSHQRWAARNTSARHECSSETDHFALRKTTEATYNLSHGIHEHLAEYPVEICFQAMYLSSVLAPLLFPGFSTYYWADSSMQLMHSFSIKFWGVYCEI